MKTLRLITVLLVCILAGAEINIIVPSFPELVQDFQIPEALAQLSVTLNLISFGSFALLGGYFLDIYGIRNTTLISLIVFLLGSVLCLYSAHYYEFLLGRCMQGAGIAAPSVLGYIVIRDDHCRHIQPGKFAYLNGTYTLAMALSMIVGEYISLWLGWKGNFFILSLLSCIALVLCVCTLSFKVTHIHQKHQNKSLDSFLLPLSGKLWIFILAMGLITIPYWVFIGLSSKIYIDIMKVDLTTYSFYQGAIAASFTGFCFMSGRIIGYWGEENSFRVSLLMCFIASAFIGALGVFQVHFPLVYTLAMCCLAGSIALPLNILYAETLALFPQFGGRVAAVTRCLRLVLTAGVSEFVISIYKGEFAFIAIPLFVLCMVYLFIVYILLSQRWIMFGYLPKQSSSMA